MFEIIGVILTFAIGLVLTHASIEDLRRRDIGSVHVVLLYILVCFFVALTGALGTQTTYVFLFAFILFMGISVFSRGQFGIGDSLVIGALALYFHTFHNFQNFLFAIAIISIPWAVYWMIRYRKDNTFDGVLHGFKQMIPIDKVKVGDVLASDNFMHGLVQSQIDKFRHDGFITLEIKKPLPFIPCILFAFLLTLLL